MDKLRAFDIWKQLSNNNTLHLRQEEGRDNQLYEELKSNLGCEKEKGLGTYLQEHPHITAIEFIQAMLIITEPFAIIYKDIYRMMKGFNVKRTNESIKLKYTLDEKEHINFDLQHFIEFETVEIKIKQELIQKIWTPEFLFEVPKFFEILTEKSLDLEVPSDNNLPFPKIKNHPELTPYLMEIYSVLLDIEENQLSKKPEWSNPYPLAKMYYKAFVNQIKVVNAEDAITYYENCFSRLETRKVFIETIKEIFEEYLNLPFWKYRWYIYEVWVTMITLEELKKYNVQLNLDKNSTLPLSSGRYSLVGSFTDKDSQLYTIHAQLQTSIEGYKNRKGICPDLRIVKGESIDSEFTKIIIEYKQRINMKIANLIENVSLYEYGAKNSWNVFVNYDKFPLSIIESAIRTKLLSNIKPNQISDFKEVFEDLLDKAQIYLPQNETFDAVLLDISYSMEDELTDHNKELITSILENIKYGKLFYFSNRLVETENQSPDSFLENIVLDISTDLTNSLLNLKNNYFDLKNILVITDRLYDSIPLELNNHFNLNEIHPDELEDYLNSLVK